MAIQGKDRPVWALLNMGNLGKASWINHWNRDWNEVRQISGRSIPDGDNGICKDMICEPCTG